MAHLERALASRDLRFAAALAEASSLYHAGEAGSLFEDHVLKIIREMLPSAYTARGLLLDGPREVQKQLDIGVFPGAVPPLVGQLNVGLLTAVGEVKTTLSEKESISETAGKLAEAAHARGLVRPVPFFVLAGKLTHRPNWLVGLVASMRRSEPAAVWPAAFSFDRDNAVSVLHSSAEAPMRAETGEGEVLDGLVTIDQSDLSPSAALYLWLWATIYADDPAHGMDFRYMRDAVWELSGQGSGLTVRFRRQPADVDESLTGVRLVLPADPPGSRALTTTRLRADAPDSAMVDDQPVAPAPGGRRVMLITLGAWVDDQDTWDESAWGGDAQATRAGYGYRSNMSDAELLDAARLFWRWSPHSGTWDGIEYAVVAHRGKTRAVLRIDRPIGPFWGRWGFQGRIVKDPTLAGELVARDVPIRQNPITTITL
ncbi:DUF6602 domain-containing protein [Micromonospora sp. NPDC048898]|uniref:DUF6602 domain-containing protein n=1 Tax=Micromonospora sp. NPDC048898 TaxID=3364260 RepID=UPI003711C00B